jgi:hypothetical protein
MVLNDVEMYISKLIYEGSGVQSDDSTTGIILTPATSPAWSADLFNTTTHHNLVVQGDSTTCFLGSVNDTAATTVSSLLAKLWDIADGTNAELTDWTAGNTYNFYLLAKGGDEYVHGDYAGYTKETTFGNSENMAEFKTNIPRQSIVEDYLEVSRSVKSKIFNPSSQAVYEMIMNTTQRGLQTSQWESHGGSAPAVRSFYRITLVGSNRDGKVTTQQFFKGQFRAEDVSMSGDDYKSLAFTFNCKVDSLRPTAYDTYFMRVDT